MVGWKLPAHFEKNPSVAAVAPAVYDTADRQRLLTSGVGYHRGGKSLICRAPDSGDSLWTAEAIGPVLLAAFYRKSALDALGGVPTAIGDRLADIDIALSLRHAGWQIASEPNCRLFAPASEISDSNPDFGFVYGLTTERLFWRHAGELGRTSSIAAHIGTVAGELIGHGLISKAPAQLLGRLVALVDRRNYRHYRTAMRACRTAAMAAKSATPAAQVPQPTAMAQEPATAQNQILRVDAAHSSHAPSEKPAARHQKRRSGRKHAG